MPDRFLTAKKCDRCGGSLEHGRIVSRFSMYVICMDCEREERQHPDYQKAADAELAAVRRGDLNFPGIGWPGKNGRVK